MSSTCLAGMRKVTSHSDRNSIILASRFGRMFWAALKAGSRSGTCAAVGKPAVRLAYSSAKNSRHILKTHWLGFSMSIVILARGHGSGSVDIFFPSNAFTAFARSLHTFNCSKKMNCELCKAVYTSIASKALVMDQYTVQ